MISSKLSKNREKLFAFPMKSILENVIFLRKGLKDTKLAFVMLKEKF